MSPAAAATKRPYLKHMCVCVFVQKADDATDFHLFLFAAAARNSGKESKTSLTLSSSQEAEECAQEEREEAKEALAPPLSNRALEAELRKQMAASLERRRAEALSSSQAAGHKVSLLDVLQQGWDLRSAPCLPRQPSIITIHHYHPRPRYYA